MTVAEVLVTLILTQKDFVPAEPMPNGIPLALFSFQKPVKAPAVVGETNGTVISTVCPGATVVGITEELGPLIWEPVSNIML